MESIQTLLGLRSVQAECQAPWASCYVFLVPLPEGQNLIFVLHQFFSRWFKLNISPCGTIVIITIKFFKIKIFTILSDQITVIMDLYHMQGTSRQLVLEKTINSNNFFKFSLQHHHVPWPLESITVLAVHYYLFNL